MKVLVVGAGGREHALCWAIAKSPKCSKLYCAPGNAGISTVAECIDIEPEDLPKLVSFSKQNGVDLVVVGPEGALVKGLVDQLTANDIRAFGPSKAAAHLEGSKSFMKNFFRKYNIPTADYKCFTDYKKAVSYLQEKGAPIVIKASGLAAGKGVTLCDTKELALQTLKLIMIDRVFGDAGDEVVVEEFLEGEEASFFALVSNKTALPMASAQDHKAAFDGDTGPNTGGMGAYSPAPVINGTLANKIMLTIIQPTIEGMIAENRPYTGLLYAGLMITNDEPKVLEYNVRFGDPECQVLMARLESDLLEVFTAVSTGQIDEIKLTWRDEAALAVVMAANGYPGSYKKGSTIRGLSHAASLNGVQIFHSGTRLRSSQIVANGGRVLSVTALGESVKDAKIKAYKAINRINWPEGFYRKDIGWKAISRKTS